MSLCIGAGQLGIRSIGVASEFGSGTIQPVDFRLELNGDGYAWATLKGVSIGATGLALHIGACELGTGPIQPPDFRLELDGDGAAWSEAKGFSIGLSAGHVLNIGASQEGGPLATVTIELAASGGGTGGGTAQLTVPGYVSLAATGGGVGGGTATLIQALLVLEATGGGAGGGSASLFNALIVSLAATGGGLSGANSSLANSKPLLDREVADQYLGTHIVVAGNNELWYSD